MSDCLTKVDLPKGIVAPNGSPKGGCWSVTKPKCFTTRCSGGYTTKSLPNISSNGLSRVWSCLGEARSRETGLRTTWPLHVKYMSILYFDPLRQKWSRCRKMGHHIQASTSLVTEIRFIFKCFLRGKFVWYVYLFVFCVRFATEGFFWVSAVRSAFAHPDIKWAAPDSSFPHKFAQIVALGGAL